MILFCNENLAIMDKNILCSIQLKLPFYDYFSECCALHSKSYNGDNMVNASILYRSQAKKPWEEFPAGGFPNVRMVQLKETSDSYNFFYFAFKEIPNNTFSPFLASYHFCVNVYYSKKGQ